MVHLQPVNGEANLNAGGTLRADSFAHALSSKFGRKADANVAAKKIKDYDSRMIIEVPQPQVSEFYFVPEK